MKNKCHNNLTISCYVTRLRALQQLNKQVEA